MSVFSVGSGGALTQVTGSPFQTGSQPVSVAFSPGGGLLAIANADVNVGFVHRRDVGGAVSLRSGWTMIPRRGRRQ